jgi:hypothetical protein
VKRLIAVLLLCSFPAAVSADGLKLFPLWEQKKCPTETFACYTFDQAKDILRIDLELQLKLEQCAVCQVDKLALTEANQKLGEAATLLEENNKILDTRLTEKQKSVEDLALTVAKMEDRDVFGKALPWVIVVVLTAAAAGFVGGWYLSK